MYKFSVGNNLGNISNYKTKAWKGFKFHVPMRNVDDIGNSPANFERQEESRLLVVHQKYQAQNTGLRSLEQYQNVWGVPYWPGTGRFWGAWQA